MLYLLLMSSLAVLLCSMLERNGILQYPALASSVYLAWVIPQLIGMRTFESSIDSDDLFILELFCLVCLVALVAGWYVGIAFGKRSALVVVSNRKLVQLAVILTFFTLSMSILMQGFETTDGSSDVNWSGPIVILYFFSNLKAVSLFIVTYLFLSGERKKLLAILILLHVFMYFPAVVFSFRRRAMLEVFVIVSSAFWFARGLILPRKWVFIGIPLGMFFVFGVGALRNLGWESFSDLSWSQISAIDFWSLTPIQNDRNYPEMANAYYIISHIRDGGFFTLGSDSWNRFVFQWVPGQLVGREIKAALMFDFDILKQALDSRGVAQRVGSTNSAFGDAYMEGGFLGCGFFFFTAFMVGSWWERARRGDVKAKIYYATSIAAATLMLTAYPFYFFNFSLLFLLVIAIGLKVPIMVVRRRVH